MWLFFNLIPYLFSADGGCTAAYLGPDELNLNREQQCKSPSSAADRPGFSPRS